MSDTTAPPTEADAIGLFEHAVQLAGGQRASASRLGISERTIRMLLSGDRLLHAGFAGDMATLLDRHADQCRNVADHLRHIAPRLPASRSKSDG